MDPAVAATISRIPEQDWVGIEYPQAIFDEEDGRWISAMLEAEASHGDHAIIEQVIADLKAGPLAHQPSGMFSANAAWLVCAAMAFNLTRAAGVIASTRHARARTATIRAQLVNVPARVANHGWKWRLHLPTAWPWQTASENLFHHAHGAATAPA